MLLRDMGREIICKRFPVELGNRSRLWLHDDVKDVLTKNTGTEATEGLSLKLPLTSRDCFEAHAFQNMDRLRLLQLDHVQIAGSYEYFSKQLRWICWPGFPSEYIPNNFHMKNVIAIDLKHSHLRLVWRQFQGLARCESCDICLPGDNHPYWLGHVGEGHSVYFTVPQDCDVKGMALCVIHKHGTVISDIDWQGIISNLGSGDKVEIFVTFVHGLVVKKTAVYLIYGESNDFELEPCREPEENALYKFIKKIVMCECWFPYSIF
ncbi:unnamed protein product [Sphenostylis stenocarpa]|uniref:Uncharacterized protein n=1 Tax=Sphenostylis stenocarpa TaxID=92480 RepID=A0AA86VBJ3_9FABA|nr:unnamed protein product [Sphenostylis stenocarpa]